MFFSRTILAKLIRSFTMRAVPAPQGRVFISPLRRYPPGGGYYWRRRWWQGLEGEEYAESTKRRKRARGLPSERVTLHDTGRMYANTKLLPAPRGWVVRVEVEYAKYLRQRYGDKIFLLVGDSRREFLQDLRNEIIKQYKQWRKNA